MRIRGQLLAGILLAALVPLGPAALVSAQTRTPSPAIPDTPAGRQFGAFLAAFNSGDSARLDAFLREQFPSRPLPPGANAPLRELTGGFDVMRVESSSDSQIVVLLQERDWEGSFARATMEVEPQPSGKITRSGLQPAPAPADRPPVARLSEAEALATLTKKLEALSAAGRFSGAVRMARRGEPVFDYVSGQADRAKGVSNTLDTQFRIGSMNKMFTAVSVLQLAQAGKVSLDAPIGTYLKDYPNKDLASRVTVRDLLTHTGGTGDIFGPEFFQRRTELCGTADYLALYGTRDVAFAPGERYAYSNYGYVLLGAIVEAVSGQDYYAYVREHVYVPAGMAASDSLPESVNVPGRSIGYTRQGPTGPLPEPVPNTDTLPCRGSAAGGGYSTVGDLIRFAAALRERKLLTPDWLRAATPRSRRGPVPATATVSAQAK